MTYKTTDENGNEWLVDKEGEFLLDELGNKIPPAQSKKISEESEFTYFDMSQGHCGLCGKLTCKGSCFK